MNDVFLQYGALGAMAFMAMFAVKVMYANAQKTWEKERERADRLEEELRQLNASVRNEYITTVSAATRAIADALAVLRRG